MTAVSANAKQRRATYSGRSNPQSKLSPESVELIKSEYASGRVSQAALAARFGVHPSTVSYLLSGRNWG